MNSSAAISTANTVIPRHLAAIADNLFAIVFGIVIAKSVYEDAIGLQVFILISVYFAYYFVFEAAIARTPGKLLTGLVVVRQDGTRASVREAAIRTAFRLLEVNPILLGFLPAAFSIVLSSEHQRFGDKFAGTIVVPASRLP